ncbi:restriction endonuclease subunit S [Salinisphaera sp. LB1]|uniref:restriction endonuclease subunit S n=1 Tax=Salinisphaera sp. LB1 TaxID=2183911 RepID=UPI0011AB5F29|nr:restriction endonuclease subunit S [Salinisphaera sp. LB1]
MEEIALPLEPGEQKWRSVRLADCCSIVSGGTPKSSEASYWNGDILWATPKDLTELDSKYISSTPRTITESGYAKSSANMLPAQSVLFSSRAPIGHVAINTVPMCTNQGFKSLVPDPNQIVPDYLYYWLRANKAQLQALGNGATFKEVSKTVISKVEIPLPPIEEQRRIAAILDKSDALRAKRREAIAKLDQLLQSVFLEMFGSPRDSSYPLASLDELCTKITDGSHITPTYVIDGVPFLRVTDIQSSNIDWAKTKYVSAQEHQRLTKRSKPEVGDVLYSKNGTIGIPKLVDWEREFSIFVSLALLKPRHEKIRGGFLESFLATPFALREAKRHSKTGTVTNLHLTEIRKIRLPLPPLAAQDRYIALREAIQSHSRRLARAQLRLDELMASIQQRAFSGRL